MCMFPCHPISDYTNNTDIRYTMGRDTGVKPKQTQPIKKASADEEKRDIKPLVKKRSLDEDELKSSAALTKKPKTEPVKPDILANPFLQGDHSEGEEELVEESEDEREEGGEHRLGGEYDNDEESDEEAESMKSLILEDFMMSQRSSSSGTHDLVDVGGGVDIDYGEDGDGNGDGDDTVSMDSEEIEAIARSATSSSIGLSSKSLIDPRPSSPSPVIVTQVTKSSGSSKPLSNVRIVFTGFSSNYEKELVEKASELGAAYPFYFLVIYLRSFILIEYLLNGFKLVLLNVVI